MSSKNAKDYLPLIQALAYGKQIQINMGSNEIPVWEDENSFNWSYPPETYRIKPKPLIRWVNVYPLYDGNVHKTKEDAVKARVSGAKLYRAVLTEVTE